jgi:uncharacterized protein YlxW (UPF0749 family)
VKTTKLISLYASRAFTHSTLVRGILLVSLCAAMGIPFAAADTESQRLAKLEEAVKALQEQNAALKNEVSELKGGLNRAR